MSPKTRSILIVVATLIVSFGIGAAWQFNQANRARQELVQAQADLDGLRYDLVMERLESTLAMSALAAQLGNYERARQLTSDFFTELQANAERAPEAAQTVFRDMLANRDETITMLSRSQPEAGLDLARLLNRYREAVGRDGGLAPSGPVEGSVPSDTAG